jgi:hypothetical protein
VWAEAAKWLGKFDEAVLTVLDADGYPASVRVDTRTYDADTGRLPAALPDELRPIEGPANLLCHYHDEKMWKLKAIQVRGRLEKRDGEWDFVTTSFNPPSKLAVVAFLKGTGTAAQKYLDRRGLERPEVNWVAVHELKRRVSDANR